MDILKQWNYFTKFRKSKEKKFVKLQFNLKKKCEERVKCIQRFLKTQFDQKFLLKNRKNQNFFWSWKISKKKITKNWPPNRGQIRPFHPLAELRFHNFLTLSFLNFFCTEALFCGEILQTCPRILNDKVSTSKDRTLRSDQSEYTHSTQLHEPYFEHLLTDYQHFPSASP